jgi:two-component system, chemotaxis family, chemotaxis protein CheY
MADNQNQLQNIQVLIVDDEEMIQRLVYDVLMRLGFRTVTVADSGRKAINLVTKQSFDFIITDWRMGDMDGIDLIRFVRSSPKSPCPHIPIILLTGNTEARYVLTARDAGVNEYIIKPFTAEQLVKRIRAIVERPRKFVEAPRYQGPDRRHRDASPPGGADRRKRKDK